MKNRWKNLCECADYQKVYQYVQEEYKDEYINILDKIESEIAAYLESTNKESQMMVDANEIPCSVQWYVGMIDTDYFLHECWL